MQEQAWGAPVAPQGADVRTRFMTRVYGHLIGAVAAFVLIELWLFSSGLAETITDFVCRVPTSHSCGRC